MFAMPGFINESKMPNCCWKKNFPKVIKQILN